ncbi:hypothetical protein [Photobacterium damselae]|uniref:hypothetical protein n=1 Tax=Photobacterium damselae TaxID=38293 RepID=UPI0018D5F9EE|nr:hypothetical protein [Photobacterium damselae]
MSDEEECLNSKEVFIPQRRKVLECSSNEVKKRKICYHDALSFYSVKACSSPIRKDINSENEQIQLERLKTLFITSNINDKDLINYAFTVRDKLSENEAVMTQIANNTREQAMLGDFPQAIDDAVMDSNEAQQEMMMLYLSNPELAKGFARVVFDMLKG